MKKTIWSLAAVVAALAVAEGAAAQACAGFPTTQGEGTFGALVYFPSGFNQLGGEGSYHTEGQFGLNGGVLVSFDDEATLITFRGGAAYSVAGAGRLLPGLSACPVVRVDFSTRSGRTLWQVPLGVGVGVTAPLSGAGTTLTGYVIPALMWAELNAGGPNTITETHFAVRGGADLSFGRFYLGGTLEWVDEEGVDALFGVRAGMKFGNRSN